ncbi:tetratricopeptide repeat protein [Ectobacillus antri]
MECEKMRTVLHQSGKLIFHKRVQQGITQEELCQGICSVSYLSKIENDKIEASELIMQLLCERLGISLSSLQNTTGEATKLLEQLHTALVYTNQEKATELYKQLQPVILQVQDAEVLNFYQLLSVRYFLLMGRMDEAICLLEECKKLSSKYSPFHNVIFHYVNGLMFCKKGEWEKGAGYFVTCEQQARAIKYSEPSIYYNLALVYSMIHNVSMSLYFVEQAIHLYSKASKFRYIIDCQVIQGINYARLKEYDKAIETYENILQAAPSFSDKEEIFARTLHNLGYLYARQGEHKKATELYLDSLRYKESHIEAYVVTMYELVKSYIELKQFPDAKVWIEKGLKASKDNTFEKRNYYLLLMLQYKYFRSSGEYKDFLEKEAIPVFKQFKDAQELKNIYIELAEYSESELEYKESNRYYKLAIAIQNR